MRLPYGAVGSFGALVAGIYLPWLDACAVQLQSYCPAPHPEAGFDWRRSLAPLLRASGWEVTLPYRYAGGAVAALDCRPEPRCVCSIRELFGASGAAPKY